MEETISEHLQDSLIYLTITDTEFAKIIGGQVPVEFFSSQIAQKVYEISKQYIRKFGKAPGDHFHDEILKKITKVDGGTRETIARYLLHLENMRKPTKEYVLDRLHNFIRSRSLINALYDSADLAEGGKIDQAINLLQEATKKGIEQEDTGISFFEYKDEIADAPERVSIIGIPLLDKYVRLERCDLVTIAGSKKGGKSWFGHHIAKTALLKGLKVLHVSHENSLRELLNRYYMMFGGLVDEEKPAKVSYRILEDGIFKKGRILRGTIYDKELVEKAKKRIKKFEGTLRLKKYPMGKCSPIELGTYIDTLENFHGFKPDIVITDYADIMAPNDASKQTRDSINETYIYLKRIADEKNLLMITMTQINDEGTQSLLRHGYMDGNCLAEDKRKLANIDKGFFVARIRELEIYDEAVVGCFANRNGIQGVKSIIGQNFRIGRFCCYNYEWKNRR